jgi:hypothetical protein
MHIVELTRPVARRQHAHGQPHGDVGRRLDARRADASVELVDDAPAQRAELHNEDRVRLRENLVRAVVLPLDDPDLGAAG